MTTAVRSMLAAGAAVAFLTTVGCSGSTTEAVSSATTQAPAKVAVGDRYGGPGTFAVGDEPAHGLQPIPAGTYRVTLQPNATSGLWARCSSVPCGPDGHDNVIASGVVGIDSRSGEATSSTIDQDGSLASHQTTITLDRGDAAFYLTGISVQLLSFG
ncbi:hypothetical protein [Mycolicibacterium fortuitum]|uniref:hypothetical protein n=1 Tax=Mycolicibacterium fortuitum TaxID=1766 RepID=UPI0007EB77CC|nr:hypothetical protein [Mycolicibacterium fortuitum]OBF77112.1 hypothetical protein A5751_23335 [Mycolicibacterium fortuitum]